jgi:hypothetical protein
VRVKWPSYEIRNGFAFHNPLPLSLLRRAFRKNPIFLPEAENITVSFSASPTVDKVKSKTQMDTCETKTHKRPLTAGFLRFSLVFSDRGRSTIPTSHPGESRLTAATY